MERQYVGIDLRRRRSVIVRRTPAGETLETVRIANDPVALTLLVRITLEEFLCSEIRPA